MRVPGIDQVQIAAKGSEDRARSFYGEVLPTGEIPKPPSLARRGGCWFASGTEPLHLGVADDVRAAKKTPLALVVEGSDGILAKCHAGG